MPHILIDQAAQARLDADLERLYWTISDPTSVQHAALCSEVLGIMPGIEAKLIPPQWQVVRRPHETVIKDGFADVHDDPECRALLDAYAEMHRYVDDGPTWPQKEECVARLAEALREYLSLRGYAVPPPSKTMALEEALSTVQADFPRDQTEAGQSEGEKANKKAAKQSQLRSWTQPDLNRAIQEYKAQRASTYGDLVEGVQQGKPGAIKAARKLFGRNAIARALGVKARAMVTKSAPWQEMAAELKLSTKSKQTRPGKAKKIGEEIAQEQKAAAAGDTTDAQILQNETIRLANGRLPAKEATALIDRLVRGEISDDQARETIDLAVEQGKEARMRRTHQAP